MVAFSEYCDMVVMTHMLNSQNIKKNGIKVKDYGEN